MSTYSKEANSILEPIPYPRLAIELQAEMAYYDPVTALHQTMVDQVARITFYHLIAHLAHSSQPTNLEKLASAYQLYRPGIKTHDKGKLGIYPDIDLSVQTINHLPPLNHPHDQDHRSTESVIAHKLHPLISGLMDLELAKTYPQASHWAQISFGHHEHELGAIPSSNGRTYRSYPRSKARPKSPSEQLFITLTQLADTVVSMGQPRIFRPFRLPDNLIKPEILGILSPDRLTQIFGPLDSDQTDQVTRLLIDATLNGLHQTQAQYSEADCLDPRLDTQTPILLPELVKAVWQNHLPRILETKNLIIQQLS